eukprot:6932899-Pyramimonas_sp.AAC.1
MPIGRTPTTEADARVGLPAKDRPATSVLPRLPVGGGFGGERLGGKGISDASVPPPPSAVGP